MTDRSILLEQLQLHGNFYLYEESVIRAAIHRLRTQFPGAQFLYSVKCNPAGRVLDTVFSQDLGADAASAAEVDFAWQRGVPRDRIYFSAPGRAEADFRHVWGRCVLIADSLHELELISRIASEKGETAEVGVRLNPDFTFTADQGVPGKFGVDQEAFFEQFPRLAALPGIRITGIHVHAKSQELDASALAAYHRRMFRLAAKVQDLLGTPLEFVNFGSGLGIPFAAGDAPLDIETVGASFRAALAEFRETAPDTRILIETGRYVVGKSGTYVTSVVDRKVSRGKTFLLLRGTLNAFARPAVSRMVRGYTDSPAPCEPLFTCPWSEELIPLTDRTEQETVTLAGNLCTAADIIAQDISLPRMEIGDGLAMTNAGCYAAVMTPMQFASLTPPAQLFLTVDGQVTDA